MIWIYNKRCNTAYKPGSVENGHLSVRHVTVTLRAFWRMPPGDIRWANNPPTVLLRIGFTADVCYHTNWWALTPPFHPYRNKSGGLFLLHFPGGHPRLTLSVILPYEARTFLTARPFGMMRRDRSAVLQGVVYHEIANLSRGFGRLRKMRVNAAKKSPKNTKNHLLFLLLCGTI